MLPPPKKTKPRMARCNNVAEMENVVERGTAFFAHWRRRYSIIHPHHDILGYVEKYSRDQVTFVAPFQRVLTS